MKIMAKSGVEYLQRYFRFELLSLWMRYQSVNNQMKAIVQCFNGAFDKFLEMIQAEIQYYCYAPFG